jgi:hypothetical protein
MTVSVGQDYAARKIQLNRGEPRKAWQIRAQLDGVWPPVWRRILIPDRITLLELHEVIQEAFGWEDYHLHQYTVGGIEYGDPDNDEYGDLDIHDETAVPLRELGLSHGESFTYIYDFGDNWTHTLRLERVLTVEDRKRLPRCLAGERACPPEDVGGIGGYAEFLEALTDPEHPEHDRYLQWIGGSFDPEAFNPKDANRRMADRAVAKRAPEWGRVPERYRNAPLGVPSVWRTTDRAEHAPTARELPLRRNMVAFLGYLRDNKVRGTSSRGNLPLKTVVEVAATFVDPPAMEVRFGNLAYPVRSEEEVWPVYFVHMLANGANLISGGPGRRWRLTQRGEQYFSAPADVQIRALLAGWWYQVDWTVALSFDIFEGGLSSWVPQSALSLLKKLDIGQRIEFEPFVDQLIEKVGWSWEGEESERTRRYIGWSMERMLIRPLESMGILTGERIKDKEQPFAPETLTAFSLTAFGRMLLQSLRS